MQALQISPRHSTATDAGLHAAGHVAGDDGGGPSEQVAEQVSAETPGRTVQRPSSPALFVYQLGIRLEDGTGVQSQSLPPSPVTGQLLGLPCTILLLSAAPITTCLGTPCARPVVIVPTTTRVLAQDCWHLTPNPLAMVSQPSAWTRMASRRLLPDSSVPIWQRLRALTRGRQTDCQLPPCTESAAARRFGLAGAILGPLVRAGLGTQKSTLGVHWARTSHLAPGQLQRGCTEASPATAAP